MSSIARRTIAATNNPAVLGAATHRNNGRYNGNGREWATPPEVFGPLHEEFQFTLDPCATPGNAKCERFYTESDDGLSKNWAGERVFMNPPYGREIYAWTRKARDSGALVVGLLPASCDLAWWHEDVVGRAEIRFIRGRVRFLTDGPYRASGFFASVVVVWRPQTKTRGRLMARIRTVKPDFWTDAAVGECSVSARLLLIASLNFADDYGGLDRSSKQLKAQAFPYDNIDCEPLVQELIRNGLFVEYEVDGRMYLHIKGFRKHQKVENPAKPRIPLYENTPKHKQTITEASPRTPRVVAVSSLEGKGMEGKGREDLSAGKPPEWFDGFKMFYPPRAGSQRWRDALRAANSRLAEGHTLEEILAGAKRYAAYCHDTGKAGTEYVLQAATFLGPNKSFLEPWTPPPGKNQLRQDANIAASHEWLEKTNAA